MRSMSVVEPRTRQDIDKYLHPGQYCSSVCTVSCKPYFREGAWSTSDTKYNARISTNTGCGDVGHIIFSYIWILDTCGRLFKSCFAEPWVNINFKGNFPAASL